MELGMEGLPVTFFVTHHDREALITLSEYDTVEQLKIEIADAFDVAIAYLHISGWHRTPETDDIILTECTQVDNINCLKVTEGISDNYDCERMDFENDSMEPDKLDLELEAIEKLKKKLPSNTPLDIKNMLLQDAVSHIHSFTNQKKALLLYLHNSRDNFSQNFMSFIHDDQIKALLNDYFFIIGWDTEDQCHHTALVQALANYSHLSHLSHLVTERIGAVVCLLPENNELSLFFCLRGKVSHKDVVRHLKSAQEQCLDVDNHLPRIEDNPSESLEIEAIKSLKRKLPPDVSVTFRHCSLDDAITSICNSSFDERKSLLLYLHNSEHPFSQMFSQNLKSGQLACMLNRNFLVLGWDVENPEYHDALLSALNRHINLAVVSDLITNRVAIALCIIPVNGTISLFMCLRGNSTLQETIKRLKEVEAAFNMEIAREKELQSIERDKSHCNDLGSEKLHSIWADMLGDRDYDGFEFDQHQQLKEKIGYGLKGPPQTLRGYDQKTLTRIDELYEVIKTESDEIAEFKDHVEISFIYNCLEPLPKEKIKRAKKFDDYNPQTDLNPVPVFILRKCRGSTNPCRIIIDDTGRVYQSWSKYLTQNKFPECEMVVPLNGRYEVKDRKVLLEKHLSPACHLDSKLLQVGDIISTVAGLASGAVFVTAAAGIAALPVAPVALVAAGVVGAGAGMWAIGRSIFVVYDRVTHKESMNFANSEARGAYLNIVAGTLGFVGAGANMAITQLAARGANIGQGATMFVNTIGVLNLGAGGASLINSGYEVFDQWYNENQTPSALTILQLSTSVLFFGHAVYNFRGAQTIIDETQARVLKDYNDSLRSNRHRKTFNKLVKETMRVHSDSARGKAEVISAIRKIPNKDDMFAALTRNNKAMNKAGIRFSADGGQITLGGMTVDMNEFIGLNKKQTETFLGNLARDHSAQQPSAPSSTSMSSNVNSLGSAVKNILTDIHVDISNVNFIDLLKITSELLIFCSGDIRTKVVDAVHQAIKKIFKSISKPIADVIDRIIPKNIQFFEFVRIGISFFSQKVDEWEQRYKKYHLTGDQSYFHPMFEYTNPVYVKRTVQIFEFVVRNSYSGQTLASAALRELTSFVTAWITRIIFENEEKEAAETKRTVHSATFRTRRVPCKLCGGYYFQH